ncbi:hypothetical protein EV702DRAFT_1050858 [Suillus placidus]|uniref:Uncharacterized protein n=1 Tax=Suillus placidus TaxID=48579 RepID=A0A9P6ZH12_9AGAM|nr:hypothetical protein EV702DRAFT_1050858 [Suillus placidus]
MTTLNQFTVFWEAARGCGIVTSGPDIPPLRLSDQMKQYGVPTKLKLLPDAQQLMEQHIDTVGIDREHFICTVESQDLAFQLLDCLHVHIPTLLQRDVRSKLAIHNTDTKVLKSKGPHGKIQPSAYSRVTCLLQCSCGTDHTAGTNGSKLQEIPWKNVGCLVWVKVIATHFTSDNSLVVIEEVSGIFDHSSACEAELEMDHDPCIPLHPELREFALALLRLNTPLMQLQEQCHSFAKQKWGDLAGDTHARYMLMSHDSTSLYRTIAREIGIPQQ